MKFFPPSLLICLAVLISCIAWIAGISWLLIRLLGLSVEGGWILVGVLGILSVAAVLILRNEVVNAIELPDDVDLDNFVPDSGHSYGERPSHAPVLLVDAAPAFRVPSQYC